MKLFELLVDTGSVGRAVDIAVLGSAKDVCVRGRSIHFFAPISLYRRQLMQEPYWWYVLYVRTNAEHKVVESFQKSFTRKRLPYELETFCPESEKYYYDKQSGTMDKMYRKRPLFPGYVFVETNMPSDVFQAEFYDVIYNSADIIRLLRYGESNDIALRQGERKRFEFLFKGKRCIEHSLGYIKGDKIIITCGPLIGMEGCIKRINRHHRSAAIEVDMFGQKQTIEVAVEIAQKI